MDLDPLVANLRNENPANRAAAAEQLARLGEETQVSALALVEAMGDDDSAVRDWVFAALESLGPPAAADASALARLVTDSKLDIAYWAATLLGRLGASAATPQVIVALASTLEKHSEIAVRQRAAWALGEIGAGAINAIPALEKATTSPDARLARLAREAIANIT